MDSQNELTHIIHDLVNIEVGGKKALADRLGVTVGTVQRWMSGEGRPRASQEGKIRALAAKRLGHERAAESQDLFASIPHEEPLGPKDALANTLGRVREVLHRSGRLSSRHEALDELAKLLFAHVMSIDTGGMGICREIIRKGTGAADSLRKFVKEEFRLHLPHSLSHELQHSDFELVLKSSEDRVAEELIDSFENTAPARSLAKVANAGELDLLNDTFGQFLADSFTDEKELGQYLTPTEVVQFMVQLGLSSLNPSDLQAYLDPSKCSQPGLILDPSCGVASFLAEVIRVLYAHVRATCGGASLQAWTERMLGETIIGIDKSERMVKLALTNLALFGVPTVNLHLANALVRRGRDGSITDRLKGQVKLILTNPPFGAEFEGKDLHEYKIANQWAARAAGCIDSELLFMERYVEWLAPGGVLVAIVPDSILTNRGLFEALRRGLTPSVRVRSVISLPAVTFGVAGTMTKTSVLHLEKVAEPVKRAGRAYFAICKCLGYEVVTRGAQRRKVSSGVNQLSPILAEIGGASPPTIGQFVSFAPTQNRWDASYHAGLPQAVQEKLHSDNGTQLRVRDVAKSAPDRTDPRRQGTGTFKYIEIADLDGITCSVRAKEIACSEAPSRARRLVREGDVLVSTVRPERRTVGVVPAILDRAVCSTGFAVLRCTRIAPLVLARLIQSDFVNAQLLRNHSGIAYPTIDECCLLDAVLPADESSLKELTQHADQVLALRAALEQEEATFRERLQEAIVTWSSSS